MAATTRQEAAALAGIRVRAGVRRRLWHLVRTQPLGTLGVFLIALVVVVAIFAPLIASQDPLTVNADERLVGLSSRHFFGTDDYGRDVFARVVWGARTSLRVGFVAISIATFSGTTIGLLTGYFGGFFDLIVQRMMDSIMAFPGLVLALTIIAALGSSEVNLFIVLGIVLTPGLSRVVRGSVLSVKENVYIEAGKSIGCGHPRLMLVHILPNILAPIIIIATAGLGGAILIEASLSFLGLGTPPPRPSWGQMLSGAGRYYFEVAPWVAIFPGVAISLAVLGFNLLGDALRDVWDPRLRGTK